MIETYNSVRIFFGLITLLWTITDRTRSCQHGQIPAHLMSRRHENMSPDNRKLKVIGSYTFRCEGVSETKVAPLLKLGRAGVSLTVYGMDAGN